MRAEVTVLLVCGAILASLAVGVVSIQSVQATSDNTSLSLLVEFKSTGRCRIKADYSGANPLSLLSSPITEVPYSEQSIYSFASSSSSTMQSASWDLDIAVTSPSQNTVTITASGWVVIPLPEEQKSMVSMGIAAYNLSPNTFNQQAIAMINPSLSSAGVSVTNLNLSRLEWDSGASRLTFAGTVTVQVSAYGESLQDELPMNITTNGSGSYPESIFTSGDFSQLVLDAYMRMVAQKVSAELQVNLSGSTAALGFDMDFVLPTNVSDVITETDDTITIDFSSLQGISPISSLPLSNFGNVTFTIVVPQNAQVENMPPGHTQGDATTYTWTGTAADTALSQLLSGESATRISYYAGPAAVTVQDIQSSVGQTITVENNSVKSVVIQSPQSILVNFEATQPVQSIQVVMAAGVQNIAVQAEQLPEKPSDVSDVPSGGAVSYYLKIETTDPSKVENATINFKVPKLWLSVNEVDKSGVKLLRYSNGSWTELQTTQSSEDDNNVYYSSQSEGFSVFAVAGSVTSPYLSMPPLLIVFIAAIVIVVISLFVMWRYMSRGAKIK
jgi:PGF-pre-PGF domain-containing protein